MRFIQHPIGLEDFWWTYGRSEQWVRSLVERNASIAMWSAIPKWKVINEELNFILLPPTMFHSHKPLAQPQNFHNLWLILCCHHFYWILQAISLGMLKFGLVWFGLVLWGIWLNCESGLNSRKRMHRTVNWTCRTMFELGLNWTELIIFCRCPKW